MPKPRSSETGAMGSYAVQRHLPLGGFVIFIESHYYILKVTFLDIHCKLKYAKRMLLKLPLPNLMDGSYWQFFVHFCNVIWQKESFPYAFETILILPLPSL